MGSLLRRGDILLFHSASKLGRAVREGQRLPGQRYAPAVNHVALVVKDGEPAREPFAIIVEGASHVRRCALFEQHADDFVWCYRPLGIAPYMLDCITRNVEGRVGEPYGFFTLLTQLADHKLFGGRVVARWLTRPMWGGVCSELVAEEFERAGHRITSERAWASSPAGIERFMLDRPAQFVQTWTGKPSEWVNAA